MIPSAFLRRILVLVLATLLLASLLTAGVYALFAQSVFEKMRAADMEPAAQAVAELVAAARDGQLPVATLVRLVESGPEYFNARILVFDETGRESLGLYPESVAGNKALLAMLESRVKKVLEGRSIVEIQPTLQSTGDLLVVGCPVLEGSTTVGAVLFVQPMTELRSAMRGLNRTLFLAMSAAFLLMLIPSYFAARRLTRPVKKMQSAAEAMTRGDFTVRADERSKGELGALAVSLNRLSMELSRTIGELTKERNELALVLDGLSEGIVAMDAAGCVTRANPAVARLAGKDPADGMKAVDSIPGLREDLEGALQDGEPRHREVPLGPLILRLSTSALLDGQGATVGAVALVRDTTESSRLEKARRDYVSNISHEFRTPVSSIRGLLEPLRDGLVSDADDRGRYYAFLLRETERLTRLIDDLLELSRLQSGTIAFEGKPFRLDRLFEETRERFQRTAAEKSVRLDIQDPAPDQPWAFGSPDRAEQVLVALVDNAVKFAPKGGIVGIRAILEGDRYHVSVSDDGPGIPPDALPFVFERFFKADGGGRTGEGSGLGLAIAREVLRGMGQEIGVTSEVGRGTKFTFTLACADRTEDGKRGEAHER